MRRKLCIIAAGVAVLLGGCGTDVPDLSHVDNDIAAQYVADALLRNDKHYDESLDYDHSILAVTPTPEPTPVPTPEPAVSGQPADDGASVQGDGGQSVSNVSLTDIYGISGVKIEQTSYELKDSYGSQGYAISPKKRGNKLAVVYFRITNSSGAAKRVNLAKSGVNAQLYLNGENAGSPLVTFADGDLRSFNEKIGAGKKKQGVLLFEVNKSAKINKLEVRFSKGNSQASAVAH